MTVAIPVEWKCNLPESLVVGDGPYAAVLASITESAILPSEHLHAGPAPDGEGGYPLVLDSLRRALLVVSDDMSAAEALRCHSSLWRWVEDLSSAGDQHDLAVVFVMPATAGREYEDALAVGLYVPAIDPKTTGHGVWRQTDTLMALIELAAAIRPMDALSLRGRRCCDAKRLALAQLRIAAEQGDGTAISAAAKSVQESFCDAEYHLDLFCNAPSHQNANLLRRWLSAGVTSAVTQDWCAEGQRNIPTWLASEPEAFSG